MQCPDCCNPIDNSTVREIEGGRGREGRMMDEECKSNEVHGVSVCVCVSVCVWKKEKIDTQCMLGENR